MKFFIKTILLLSIISIPLFGLKAQSPRDSEGSFRAIVLEILQQEEKSLEDGSKIIQQNIKLKGTGDEWKNEEIIFEGISDIIVTKSSIYKKGDKVIVNYFKNPDGENIYYISDFVRTGSLYLLIFIFVLTVILVSKWKGVAAIISLILSFIIIMKIIIPLISEGYNPLFIAILGSFFILFFIIYITEGFHKKSHFAILSISICLIITAFLSYIFTYITKLSGMAQEEVFSLVAYGKTINFQGLLLAGIVVGTLGVLDDIVVSQIESIVQIKKAKPKINKLELLKMANKIGASHLGAIINTLFLAYAGVSLPLLMLFTIGEGSFSVFGQIINNEMIATEIVRTLIGVIGLTLSIPITNLLMVYFYASIKDQEIIKNEPKFNIYKV